MSTHHDQQPRPAARPDPDEDERRSDEAVEEMRAGRGLGGRTLGRLGTTGGTAVGAKLQDETGTGGHREDEPALLPEERRPERPGDD